VDGAPFFPPNAVKAHRTSPCPRRSRSSTASDPFDPTPQETRCRWACVASHPATPTGPRSRGARPQDRPPAGCSRTRTVRTDLPGPGRGPGHRHGRRRCGVPHHSSRISSIAALALFAAAAARTPINPPNHAGHVFGSTPTVTSIRETSSSAYEQTTTASIRACRESILNRRHRSSHPQREIRRDLKHPNLIDLRYQCVSRHRRRLS